MYTARKTIFVFLAILIPVTVVGDGLDDIEVVGEGHPSDILGIKPSVVYVTTPRLTPLAQDLRMMSYLLKEMQGQINGTVVVYGEDPKVVAGFRERLGFSIFPASGELPGELIGEEGGLPLTLFYDAEGSLIVNRPHTSIPDPLDTSLVFDLDYNPGEKGPIAEEAGTPFLVFMASDKKTYELTEFITGRKKSIIYILDIEDERREERLTRLQYLQDDLGVDIAVVPILLNATQLKGYRLADAYMLDFPIMIGGSLAEYNLVGDAELPFLIILDENGEAELVNEEAEVPGRNDITAEEILPAGEGPPVPFEVQFLTRVTEGLRSNVVSTTSWTSDSEDIVFNGRFGDENYDHIFRITRAGKNLHQITYGQADDISPSCAADGNHLTFCSTRTGAEEIWLSELVYGQFTRVTKYEGTAQRTHFGREGDLVIFQRRKSEGGKELYDLWLMTPIGRRAHPIKETLFNETNADLIRTEDLVVFQSDRYGNDDIFTSDMDGGKRRRLTTYEGSDVTPAFSPGGKYVVWASDRDGDFDIWAMNRDGSSKAKLTDGNGDDTYPCFSPDGRYLSFTRLADEYSDIFKITFRPIPDYDGIRPQRYIRLSKSVYKDKYRDDDNLDWLYPGK
ncbi:MAG: hypothetical protein GY771_11795 [bacterium]|nr:hypothetical protein [bacterium]